MGKDSLDSRLSTVAVHGGEVKSTAVCFGIQNTQPCNSICRNHTKKYFEIQCLGCWAHSLLLLAYHQFISDSMLSNSVFISSSSLLLDRMLAKSFIFIKSIWMRFVPSQTLRHLGHVAELLKNKLIKLPDFNEVSIDFELWNSNYVLIHWDMQPPWKMCPQLIDTMISVSAKQQKQMEQYGVDILAIRRFWNLAEDCDSLFLSNHKECCHDTKYANEYRDGILKTPMNVWWKTTTIKRDKIISMENFNLWFQRTDYWNQCP